MEHLDATCYLGFRNIIPRLQDSYRITEKMIGFRVQESCPDNRKSTKKNMENEMETRSI